MSKKMVPPEQIDSRLQELLEAYKRTPERIPENQAKGRARFMEELDRLYDDRFSLPGWLAGLKGLIEKNVLPLRYRSALNLLAILSVIALLLFGGVGTTVHAAKSALPGDALYPVRLSLEDARASRTSNLALRAHTYLDFAGQRLADISVLIEQGRYTNLMRASQDFQDYLQKALLAARELAQTDPVQADALYQEILAILSDYNAQLDKLKVSVPAEAQPVIQDALDASEASATQASNDESDGSNDDGSNDAGSNDAGSNDAGKNPADKSNNDEDEIDNNNFDLTTPTPAPVR